MSTEKIPPTIEEGQHWRGKIAGCEGLVDLVVRLHKPSGRLALSPVHVGGIAAFVHEGVRDICTYVGPEYVPPFSGDEIRRLRKLLNREGL